MFVGSKDRFITKVKEVFEEVKKNLINNIVNKKKMLIEIIYHHI